MLVGEALCTEAELACPKCRMFGCDCNPPAAPRNRSAMADTCTACHRPKAACICRSHHPFTPLPDDYQRSRRATHKLTKPEVDSRVNEAVALCYDRDFKAVAALVRGWFE